MGLPQTGTTSAVRVSARGAQSPVRRNEGYFLIQVYGAQAVYIGSFWETAKQLVVVSRVALSHDSFRESPAVSLQRVRSVRKNQAINLGLATNLVQLTPATMDKVTVSVEFIIDRENKFAQLAGVINEDALLATVSLAPGAVGAVRAVGQLAAKMLATFLNADERVPVLQFTGDFNLAAAGIEPGYHVILASTDPSHPLPSAGAQLEVRNGGLLIDGAPASDLSYVILDVVTVPALGRDSGTGPWRETLNRVEAEWTKIAKDPLASVSQRKESWKRCCSVESLSSVGLSNEV
jgi:hypothetical protein